MSLCFLQCRVEVIPKMPAVQEVLYAEKSNSPSSLYLRSFDQLPSPQSIAHFAYRAKTLFPNKRIALAKTFSIIPRARLLSRATHRPPRAMHYKTPLGAPIPISQRASSRDKMAAQLYYYGSLARRDRDVRDACCFLRAALARADLPKTANLHFLHLFRRQSPPSRRIFSRFPQVLAVARRTLLSSSSFFGGL